MGQRLPFAKALAQRNATDPETENPLLRMARAQLAQKGYLDQFAPFENGPLPPWMDPSQLGTYGAMTPVPPVAALGPTQAQGLPANPLAPSAQPTMPPYNPSFGPNVDLSSFLSGPQPGFPELPPELAEGLAGGKGGTKIPGYKPPNTADFDSLMLKLQGVADESRRSQQGGVDKLLEEKQRMNDMPFGIDMKPLMALSDAWWGGDLAKNYQSPESPEARQEKLVKMEQAIQNARNGISETDASVIKALLGAEQGKLGIIESSKGRHEMAAARAEARGDAEKTRQVFKDQMQEEQARQGLLKNKQVDGMEGLTQMASVLNRLEEAMGKYGTMDRLAGEGKAELDSIKGQFTLASKKGEDLGALAGPDMQLIFQNLRTPSGVDALVQALTAGGDAGTRLQLKQMRQRLHMGYENSITKLTRGYKTKDGRVRGNDLIQGINQQYLDQYKNNPAMERFRAVPIGTIEQSSRGKVMYVGGDPANPNNWDEVK
jgi:hypothetical protein